MGLCRLFELAVHRVGVCVADPLEEEDEGVDGAERGSGTRVSEGDKGGRAPPEEEEATRWERELRTDPRSFKRSWSSPHSSSTSTPRTPSSWRMPVKTPGSARRASDDGESGQRDKLLVRSSESAEGE